MNFYDALEAAGVPKADQAAFQIDAHAAWLAVAEPLEVPAIRAVLRDPDLCLAVRAAWALGGVEAAAGVVKRESYPMAAQGGGHEAGL